jgi:curved DNA-binding protein CbpA
LNMNPYLVLGVPPDADDRTIRQAYLDKIRVATPERNPQQFQVLTAAYNQIQDMTNRRRHILFDTTVPARTLTGAFLEAAALSHTPEPPSFNALKELLRSCATK